ncbi:P-type DNA transfer ATPase VirB11 [Rhizobium leguminosarum]|nr:P-type DNA transfer ATPase VirB11 [Rhizobium leguminosarum]
MNDHQLSRHISYVEHYLDPLRFFLTDDNINEVVINPDGSVFIEKAGALHMQKIDVTLPRDAIKRLAAQLAGETRNPLGELHPIFSGRVMVWGHPQRVQVVVEPAIEEGVSLSIRKHLTQTLTVADIDFLDGEQINVNESRRECHRTLADLAKSSNLSGLFRHAIAEKSNILISGGTSSGKTTVARALLAISDSAERIITIEDAQELDSPHKNQVRLLADRDERSARNPSRLLESCLRMRPDRILLGEIRGAEAYAFLEAINTGHPGAIATLHADSPQLAFERLAFMVMRSGIQMSHGEIIDYARRTIDLVVQVGRRHGRRGVLEIYLPPHT